MGPGFIGCFLTLRPGLSCAGWPGTEMLGCETVDFTGNMGERPGRGALPRQRLVLPKVHLASSGSVGNWAVIF